MHDHFEPLNVEESGRAGFQEEEEEGSHYHRRFRTALITAGLLAAVLMMYKVCLPDAPALTAVQGVQKGLLQEDGQLSPGANRSAICKSAQAKEGNMTFIASPAFTPSDPWPTLNSNAYSAISRCITAVPICNPKNLVGMKDVRSLYKEVAGTAMVDSFLSRALNAPLMGQLQRAECHGKGQGCTAREFDAAVTQLAQELQMVMAVSGWYAMCEGFLMTIKDQISSAFVSMLVLLSMPVNQQVAQPKAKWVGIVFETMVAVGSVVGNEVTLGGFAAVQGAYAVSAALISAGTAAQKCAKNCGSSSSVIAPTVGAERLEFVKMVDVLMALTGQAIGTLSVGLPTTVDNWSRLQSAYAVVAACPLDPAYTDELVLEAFPAMQWIALGVLMPNKYVLFFQRDYGGSSRYAGKFGGLCYYGQNPSGKGVGCSEYTIGGQNGCYQPKISSIDSCDFYNSLYRPKDSDANSHMSSEGTGCQTPQRYVWVGEVGQPSNTPPSEFWEGLAALGGPVSNYINKIFGTNYEGPYGAFSVMTSQCAYVPKLFIPKVTNGVIDPSLSVHVESDYPSQVSVDCDVYGAHLPVYAFQDCGMFWNDGTCTNGWGNGWDGDFDSTGTGNFNQRTFIPTKAGHFSDPAAGSLGCCFPWTGGVLPSECDFTVCDCWSIQVMLNKHFITQAQYNSAYLECGKPSTFTTNILSDSMMMQTSLNQSNNWTVVITSGGQ